MKYSTSRDSIDSIAESRHIDRPHFLSSNYALGIIVS